MNIPWPTAARGSVLRMIEYQMTEILNNVRTVLLLGLVAGPCAVVYAQDTPADTPVLDTPLEEITVIGQRSIMSLRIQVDKAVDRMYSIYNEINQDDDYDIVCRREAPTGSRIKRKLCTPVYVERLQTEATQRALYDMDESGSTSLYIDYTEIARNDVKLRENMKKLILENPELLAAVLEHVRLRDELKRQRQAFWGFDED